MTNPDELAFSLLLWVIAFCCVGWVTSWVWRCARKVTEPLRFRQIIGAGFIWPWLAPLWILTALGFRVFTWFNFGRFGRWRAFGVFMELEGR